MPSTKQFPTIKALIDAYAVGARSVDKLADTREGSIHDLMAGVGALVWSREASRDRDLFREVYTDECRGDDLDERLVRFGGPARVLATRGQGRAEVLRPPTGEETLWAGTRLSVLIPGQTRSIYRVQRDVVVQASPLSPTVLVPIEADETGAGFGLPPTTQYGARLAWEDQVADAIAIQSVECADGTEYEKDTDYLARYRAAKRSRRLGYEASLVAAFEAAGATHVALFRSDWLATSTAGTEDKGYNRAFVGGPGYDTPTDILNACRVAADSARVAGATLQVFGMQRADVTINMNATLRDLPSAFNQDALEQEIVAACLRYFEGRANPYVFSRDSLVGEILRTNNAVRDIEFLSPTPNETSRQDILGTSCLNRYFLASGDVSIALLPPT